MDAFYVSVELRRRPELRGQPVIVAGSGPRAVVTTASYEARRFGVGSAMPGLPGPAPVPGRGVPAAGLPVLPRGLARGDGARARLLPAVEVVGLDEAYLDLTGLPGAARGDARGWRAEISTHTGLHCSVGIGPNKLVAKVASDAEKPRGFVVLTREQACARFAARALRADPGHRPEDRRAPEARWGSTRSASWRRPRPSSSPSAFGARLGRGAAAPRALRGRRRRSPRSARSSRSPGRRPSTTTSPTRPRWRRCWSASSEKLCSALVAPGAARAHDRHQGAPRRLLHPHPGPDAGRARGPIDRVLAGGAGAAAAVRRAAAGPAAGRARGRTGDGGARRPPSSWRCAL